MSLKYTEIFQFRNIWTLKLKDGIFNVNVLLQCTKKLWLKHYFQKQSMNLKLGIISVPLLLTFIATHFAVIEGNKIKKFILFETHYKT